MWAAIYLNEKECRPVVIKAYPRGYSQCQSDRSIDRPFIWYTRYSDLIDFSHNGLLSQEPMELGPRRRIRYARQSDLG
ncbi:hypothetical protein TNCV_169591 [Trichonephila clavipes]|nr:hypothetical protein TNCV_169591 [Trichonephila clavipes]